MKKIICTILLVYIFADAKSQNITNFYEDDNAIYYWQNVRIVGYELFSFDKKTKKISLVRDIMPGENTSDNYFLTKPVFENGIMYAVFNSYKYYREEGSKYSTTRSFPTLYKLNLVDKSSQIVGTDSLAKYYRNKFIASKDILVGFNGVVVYVTKDNITLKHILANDKDYHSTEIVKSCFFKNNIYFILRESWTSKPAKHTLFKVEHDGTCTKVETININSMFFAERNPDMFVIGDKLVMFSGYNKGRYSSEYENKMFQAMGVWQFDGKESKLLQPYDSSQLLLKSTSYLPALKGTNKYFCGFKESDKGDFYLNELLEMPESLDKPIKLICKNGDGIFAIGATTNGYYSIREKGDSMILRYRTYANPNTDSFSIKFKLKVAKDGQIVVFGDEVLFALEDGKIATINIKNKAIVVYNPTADDDGDGIVNALDNCENNIGIHNNNGCPEPNSIMPQANNTKLWGKNFGTNDYDDLISLTAYGDSSFYFSTQSNYMEENVPMLKFNYHEIFGKQIVHEDKYTGAAITSKYVGSDNLFHYMREDKYTNYSVNVKTHEVKRLNGVSGHKGKIDGIGDTTFIIGEDNYCLYIQLLNSNDYSTINLFDSIYINSDGSAEGSNLYGAIFSSKNGKYAYTTKIGSLNNGIDGDNRRNVVIYFSKNKLIKVVHLGNYEFSIKNQEKNFVSTIVTNTGFTVFCSTTDNYDDPKIPYQRAIRVMDYDTLGNLINTKILPALNYKGIAYKDAILTNDGGYMVAAEMMQDSSDFSFKKNSNPQDIILFKYSKDLKLEWHKQLIGNKSDYFSKLVQLKNNNYVLAVQTTSDGGDYGTNKGNFDLWIGIIPDYKVPVAKAIKPVIVKTPVVKKPQPTKSKN